MAILRAELKGKETFTHTRRADGTLGTRVLGVYDGIIETAADLALPRTEDFAPGSLLFCLDDQGLYIKNSAGQWQGVTG